MRYLNYHELMTFDSLGIFYCFENRLKSSELEGRTRNSYLKQREGRDLPKAPVCSVMVQTNC